ncbi:hypothetical protein CLOM_g18450 [Closterium sp. NIES-68]|nr:hypothetical protein CLOM_g18450 [Closterium sp. NIES-68]
MADFASYYDAIFFVVDKLTKMAHFAAYKKSILAEETIRLFISTVVRLHGIPSTIISDRDTKFTSNLWRNLGGTNLVRAYNSPPPITPSLTVRPTSQSDDRAVDSRHLR